MPRRPPSSTEPPRFTWGGARPGAGRPPSGTRPSERHKARTPFAPHEPVHIAARIAPAVIRRVPADGVRAAIDRAIHLAHGHDDFRVVHVALYLDVAPDDLRVELIVEARDPRTLARAMQGFQISAARTLNRLARRRGPGVFPDRYRARVLASRRALAAAIAALPRDARTRIVTPHSPLFER